MVMCNLCDEVYDETENDRCPHCGEPAKNTTSEVSKCLGCGKNERTFNLTYGMCPECESRLTTEWRKTVENALETFKNEEARYIINQLL